MKLHAYILQLYEKQTHNHVRNRLLVVPIVTIETIIVIMHRDYCNK